MRNSLLGQKGRQMGRRLPRLSKPTRVVLSGWAVFLLLLSLVPVGYRLRQMYLDRALISALKQGDTDSVMTLLEQGANANAQVYVGGSIYTPLVDNEDPTCFQLLLDYGADVNMQNGQGRTILRNIVLFHPDRLYVQTLLERGARVTICDNSGKTPLDYARMRKDTDNIPLLEAAARKEQAQKDGKL